MHKSVRPDFQKERESVCVRERVKEMVCVYEREREKEREREAKNQKKFPLVMSLH